MTVVQSNSPSPVLARRIIHRTRGRRHGPITRLMSPGDLGEVLKPFVFLDLIDMTKATFPNFGLHPHSGIATLTHLFEGDIRYEDTTGATGALPQGGVEWFKAGHGAWHGGGAGDSERTRGFQLWVALPGGTGTGSRRKHLPGARGYREGRPGQRPARLIRGGGQPA